MKNRRNLARHHVGLALALVGLVGSITLMPGHSRPASAPVTAPSWSFTGSLNTARGSHTATLLPNGKVLVAGGANSNGSLGSGELYDPATGTWSSTGILMTARSGHSATRLLNGKVLVAGGYTCPTGPGPCSAFNTAELYDPATGTWSNTGSLNTARTSHTATLLTNGKVLVAGGANSICQPGVRASFSTQRSCTTRR